MRPRGQQSNFGASKVCGEDVRSSHVHIVQLCTVLPCLKDENLHIGVFRQAASDNRAASPASAHQISAHSYEGFCFDVENRPANDIVEGVSHRYNRKVSPARVMCEEVVVVWRAGACTWLTTPRLCEAPGY